MVARLPAHRGRLGSRALCAPCRCRAVRGNGDEGPRPARAHTAATKGRWSGAGALGRFLEDHRVRAGEQRRSAAPSGSLPLCSPPGSSYRDEKNCRPWPHRIGSVRTEPVPREPGWPQPVRTGRKRSDLVRTPVFADSYGVLIRSDPTRSRTDHSSPSHRGAHQMTTNPHAPPVQPSADAPCPDS